MKILRILPTINPAAGGVQECVLQSGEALELEGIQQDILTLDTEEYTIYKNSKNRIFAMGDYNKKNYYISNYGLSIKFIKWLINHAKEYDKIIIDGIWQFHSFGSMMVLKKLNIEYYVYIHGMLDPWFKKAYPIKHLKKTIYWYLVEYWVIKNAKLVFYTCEEERVRASKSFKFYSAKEKVIPIGIKQPELKKQEQKEAVKNHYPELQGKINILFLSRIHPKKGCDLIIKAFSSLAKDNEKYHLIMAGPGSEKYVNSLKIIAKQNDIDHKITWTGMVTGNIKIGLYLSSNIFVLPSHQENFGIVVAESLACNLPVIISNKVNIWREIDDSNSGLICNDELRSLTDVLSDWSLLSKKQIKNLEENSIKCFLKNFEIQNSIKILINTLKIN